MKLRVAVAQYSVPEGAEQAIVKLDEFTRNAKKAGVKLLVAPGSSLGYIENSKFWESDWPNIVQNIAKKNKIFLSTSFYKEVNKKIHSISLLVDNKGKIHIDQSKIYLSPPERDNYEIQSGNKLFTSETKLGKLGTLQCKDAYNRYSGHLFYKIGQEEVDIITIPSKSVYWKKLYTEEYVKASAIYGSFLSRSFVLMSGTVNKNKGSFGRSLIVSPIYGVLAEGTRDKEELLIKEIDISECKKARNFDEWWQPRKEQKIE